MPALDRPLNRAAVSDREVRFVLALLGEARMDTAMAWRMANEGRRQNSTDDRARIAASRMMARPRVMAMIEAELRRRHARLEITADRVLDEVGAVAFTTLDEVMTWDEQGVHLTPSAQLSRKARAAIQQIEVKELRTGEGENAVVTRTVKLRMHAKAPALDLLMRHFRLLDADPLKRDLPPFGGLVIVAPGGQLNINGGSGNGHASGNGSGGDGHGNGHGNGTRVVTLGPYEATVDDGSGEGEEAGDAAGVADPEADGEGEGR